MAEAVSPATVPTPTWGVIPFVGYLVLIALLPLVAARLWESNRNKLILAIIAGIPAVACLAGQPAGGLDQLLRTACDYVAFMALLGALFAISGGIRLRGALIGSPLVNTVFLAAGALLASLVGTTGASALLIRPLLRANAHRARTTHIVVFFIFIVANAGGLLTPLGDPPLFLGFLRGVPFAWTLRLAPAWALVNGVLLALFVAFDRIAVVRERGKPRPPRPSDPALEVGPLRLEGSVNLFWLMGIVGVVFATGMLGAHLVRFPQLQTLAQVAGMALFAALSWFTTPREVREGNRFSWAPMVEVAAIFLGVFVTMIPALSYLEQRGASLGVTQPWQFFWASGALSSVLDNAPTYLTFASLAVGVTDAGGGLGALAAHPTGQHLLAAVSCGSVMMGAVTYIGNGPNFMVKAIAEQHRVRTPSFFGYVVWSGAILLPLFALVSHLFF
jgi:Na+/H+ antiporter NhaD/arsenite permease-like protein